MWHKRKRKIPGALFRQPLCEPIPEAAWTSEHEQVAQYNREIRGQLQTIEKLIVPYSAQVKERSDQTHNGIELVLTQEIPHLLEFPNCKVRPLWGSVVTGYIVAAKLPTFKSWEGKQLFSPEEWYTKPEEETVHRVGIARPLERQEWPLTLVGRETSDTNDRLLWVNTDQIQRYDLLGWFARHYGRTEGQKWGLAFNADLHYEGEKA
jgi:hypothetical protein